MTRGILVSMILLAGCSQDPSGDGGSDAGVDARSPADAGPSRDAAGSDSALGDAGADAGTVAPARPQTMAANGSNSCAVVSGRLYCWGHNGFGQLADGTTEDSLVPVEIEGLSGVVEVTAGGVFGGGRRSAHICVIDATGARCWGRNDHGQLGDGTTDDRATPTPVVLPPGEVPSRISAGRYHTCAVMESGSVYCWGDNTVGQLGDGTTTSSSTPVALVGVDDGVEVTTGSGHSCAVRAGGVVTCWGSNGHGELGDGMRTTAQTTPVDTMGLGPASEVAAGRWHSCARTGGAVLCWGENESGQLGDGTLVDSAIPVGVVDFDAGPARIETGTDHSCALRADGSVACWGRNESGQVGDGTTGNRDEPQDVLANVEEVATGLRHTCARKRSGEIWCWGDNEVGQLGDGTTTGRLTPTRVSGLP